MTSYSNKARKDWCRGCNLKRHGREFNNKFWCNTCLDQLVNSSSYQLQPRYSLSSNCSHHRKSADFKLNIAQIRAQRKSLSPDPTANKTNRSSNRSLIQNGHGHGHGHGRPSKSNKSNDDIQVITKQINMEKMCFLPIIYIHRDKT